MAHLLIIGGASSDILHIPGRKISSAGGAGMYTAMAAVRNGVQVSMFGPRPEPIPDQLIPIERKLFRWFGPEISADELPEFEISYEHGKTEYLKANINAEAELTTAMLPTDLSRYDLVHVTPIGDAKKQLAFIQECKQRGATKISAGTGLFNATEQFQEARAVFHESDYCFLNVEEAYTLYGSIKQIKCKPAQVFFITLGEKGALVIQGTYVTELAAVTCEVVDPTGAGDTFCGSTNAQLILGNHPIMSARKAMALAAEMIQQPGPAALLLPGPAPDSLPDNRVIVANRQVEEIAKLIAALPEVTPFDFTGDGLPPVGHPLALNWFFMSTLQQFGFWTIENGKYHLPLIAPINGKLQKGSDYLWQAYMKPFVADPEFFSPMRQAKLTLEDLIQLYRADDDTDPMPAIELHLDLARQYGQDMLALKLTPQMIVEQSRDSDTPLKTFFNFLDHVGGYKEDPLRKKSGLLAFILNQRPEMFLPLADTEEITPVIDYHVMRTCLRTGLVEIVDQELRERIIERQVLDPVDEEAIRSAAYAAMEQVTKLSGKSMGAVDWFFFNSRTRCPEMTEPECALCPVDPVCAHNKSLFQPVMRTTFY
jgi:sugar/nucleoside kinase (ribokinase family)